MWSYHWLVFSIFRSSLFKENKNCDHGLSRCWFCSFLERFMVVISLVTWIEHLCLCLLRFSHFNSLQYHHKRVILQRKVKFRNSDDPFPLNDHDTGATILIFFYNLVMEASYPSSRLLAFFSLWSKFKILFGAFCLWKSWSQQTRLELT